MVYDCIFDIVCVCVCVCVCVLSGERINNEPKGMEKNIEITISFGGVGLRSNTIPHVLTVRY